MSTNRAPAFLVSELYSIHRGMIGEQRNPKCRAGADLYCTVQTQASHWTAYSITELASISEHAGSELGTSREKAVTVWVSMDRPRCTVLYSTPPHKWRLSVNQCHLNGKWPPLKQARARRTARGDPGAVNTDLYSTVHSALAAAARGRSWADASPLGGLAQAACVQVGHTERLACSRGGRLVPAAAAAGCARRQSIWPARDGRAGHGALRHGAGGRWRSALLYSGGELLSGAVLCVPGRSRGGRARGARLKRTARPATESKRVGSGTYSEWEQRFDEERELRDVRTVLLDGWVGC